MSLDSNERTKYKAREMKSVFLTARGSFLKMRLHQCFTNTYNLFNQVGCGVGCSLCGVECRRSKHEETDGDGGMGEERDGREETGRVAIIIACYIYYIYIYTVPPLQ